MGDCPFKDHKVYSQYIQECVGILMRKLRCQMMGRAIILHHNAR